ncbi:MAG: hypothetical protein EZS28_011335 [Streblomastix strix]|uniref:RAI1-like domain-containing protein n=1 Tax=Streblomastix strix TaxID=222440 RepID=A0A5J4WE15_9EUKA|nr:MAG: hypothetical protein EZS28_011335 [Streblomastix strix]
MCGTACPGILASRFQGWLLYYSEKLMVTAQKVMINKPESQKLGLIAGCQPIEHVQVFRLNLQTLQEAENIGPVRCVFPLRQTVYQPFQKPNQIQAHPINLNIGAFETLCSGRLPDSETVLNEFGAPFVSFYYIEVITLSHTGMKIGMAFEADSFKDKQLDLKSSPSFSSNYFSHSHSAQQQSSSSSSSSIDKLRRAWAQCYISGVPHIIYGFADDHGILADLRQYDVSGVPGLCRNYWNMDFMMTLLESVLGLITQIVRIKVEEQKQIIQKQPDAKLIPIRFSVKIHVEEKQIILEVLPYSPVKVGIKLELECEYILRQIR